METHLGRLRSDPVSGRIGLDPGTPEIEAAVEEGRVSQIRVLAEPTEPVAVCRLLLKMAIEVIANDSRSDALSERHDAARTFARAPRRRSTWWFLIHTDHDALFNKFQMGLTYRKWMENIELRVSEINGAEMFILKLLDMSLMTPVLENVVPHYLDELPGPEYRLFQVQQP